MKKIIYIIVYVVCALLLVGGLIVGWNWYQHSNSRLSKNIDTQPKKQASYTAEVTNNRQVNEFIQFTFVNDLTNQPMSGASIEVEKSSGVICETVNCSTDVITFTGTTDAAGILNIPHTAFFPKFTRPESTVNSDDSITFTYNEDVLRQTSASDWVNVTVNDNGGVHFYYKELDGRKNIISNVTSDVTVHLIKE